MNLPRHVQLLRVAWSVAWGVGCLLLVGLWVRSYTHSEGAGIAFQPCWMVNALLQRGELVRLLPAWSGPAQHAWLVHPRRRRQPMRVQLMKDLLVGEIQAL